MRAIGLLSLIVVLSSSTVSRAQTCTTPPTRLVSWWSGDGHADDIYGPNHGVPQNGALFAAGKVGDAFTFDGIDDYVNVDGVLNSALSTSSGTIEMWVRVTDSSRLEQFFTISNSAGGQLFQILSNSGSIQASVRSGTQVLWTAVTQSIVLSNNVWHHVAVAQNGVSPVIYVDGVSRTLTFSTDVDHTKWISSVAGANNARIGIRSNGLFPSPLPLQGSIDELCIYDRALSAVEISAIYQAGSAGKCKLTPAPFNASYDAQSGAAPDAACPAWLSTDTDANHDPVVSGGLLTLTTGPGDYQTVMQFAQHAPDIEIPAALAVEARLRFVSGQSIGANRSAVVISLEVLPFRKAVLIVSDDRLWLQVDDGTPGPAVVLDTNGALHTYRIDVLNYDRVQVFYDGAMVLDGFTFLDNLGALGFQRVTWGDPTVEAFGTSEWAYFRHNAGTTACPEFGTVSGQVLAPCPSPATPLYGVLVDAYEVGSGDLAGSDTTGVDGFYSIGDLPADDYVVTVVAPLGYTTPSPEVPVTITAGGTVDADILLECAPIANDARGMGFWKHQVGVATGGKGHAQIDAVTLCGYLDLIEAHFNSNAINHVVVYDPPAGATCADKLLVARELLNLKGNVGMTARAKQHLLSLLLNVAGNYLSLRKSVSVDAATVSQAITYCDHLIDDADLANDQLAKDIAEQVNEGVEIAAGVIPLSTDDIAYAPIVAPQPTADFGIEGAVPNPFNPRTTISYTIASEGRVRLRVYDARGALVRTLVDTNQPGGLHSVSWDGSDAGGSTAPSGIYFVRLDSNGQIETRKIALLK